MAPEEPRLTVTAEGWREAKNWGRNPSFRAGREAESGVRRPSGASAIDLWKTASILEMGGVGSGEMILSPTL